MPNASRIGGIGTVQATSGGSGATFQITAAGGVAAGHSITVKVAASAVVTGAVTPPFGLTDDAGNWYAIDDFRATNVGNPAWAFIASAHNIQALAAGQHITITFTPPGGGVPSVKFLAATADEWQNLGLSPLDTSGDAKADGAGATPSPSATAAATTYAVDAVIGCCFAFDAAAAVGETITDTGGVGTFGQSVQTALVGGQTLAVFEQYLVSSSTGTQTISGNLAADVASNFFWMQVVCTYQSDRRIVPVVVPNITRGLPESPDRWLVEVLSATLVSGQRPSAEIDLCHLSATVRWRGLGTGTLDVPWNATGYSLLVEGNYVILTDMLSGWQWQALITDVQQSETAERPEQRSCGLTDLRGEVYARIIAWGETAGITNTGSGSVAGTLEASYTYASGTFTGTDGFLLVSGATESLCKTLVRQNLVSRNPITGQKAFRVAGTQQRGVIQYIKVQGEALSQRLPSLLAVDDFGDTVRILQDGTALTLEYDVLRGVDRSAGTPRQQIFSVNLDNVSEINYVHGRAGHVNAVLVMGRAGAATAPSGGGAVTPNARPNRWVEDSAMITAHGRIEAVVDANDATAANELTTAGQFYLALHQEVLKLTFVARASALSGFGTTWQVGDLVSVENVDWNVIQNVRVQAIQIDVGNPDLKLETAAETMNFMEYAAAQWQSAPGGAALGLPAGALPASVTPALARQMGGNSASGQQFHMGITVGRDASVGAALSWRTPTTTAIRTP